jgi:hypothetical protein
MKGLCSGVSQIGAPERFFRFQTDSFAGGTWWMTIDQKFETGGPAGKGFKD